MCFFCGLGLGDALSVHGRSRGAYETQIGQVSGEHGPCGVPTDPPAHHMKMGGILVFLGCVARFKQGAKHRTATP